MTGDIIYKALVANSAFSALAASRVYPLVLPESPDLPAAAYTITGTTRHSSHDEVGGLSQSTVRVDCVAESYPSAKAVASAVRVALGGYAGSAGQRVLASFPEDESMDYNADDIEGRRFFIHTITFQVWTKETSV